MSITIEQAVEVLENSNRDLRNKNLDARKEADNIARRKEGLLEEIEEINESKALAIKEREEEQVKLREIKKEYQGIKDDCQAEIGKAKKEWDDLEIEARKVNAGVQLLNKDKEQLAKDRIMLKDENKKLVARQANLDQQEASLKAEKEKQSNREKHLNEFSSMLEKRDVQSLIDSGNLKKEGERLANIAKSLEEKKREQEKKDSILTQYSQALDLREKGLNADIAETTKLNDALKNKIAEAEASKKQYSDAYAGLAQKEKEVEIKRLQLIKIGKEKMTEEILKKLEAEANA